MTLALLPPSKLVARLKFLFYFLSHHDPRHSFEIDRLESRVLHDFRQFKNVKRVLHCLYLITYLKIVLNFRPGSRKFLKTHPGPIPRARFHPVLLPIPDFISKTTLLDRLACRRDLYRRYNIVM